MHSHLVFVLALFLVAICLFGYERFKKQCRGAAPELFEGIGPKGLEEE